MSISQINRKILIPPLMVLSFLSWSANQSSGDEVVKKMRTSSVAGIRTLVEKRFGKPDRVLDREQLILNYMIYHLENGDSITFVLSKDSLLGVEHTKKTDLRSLVGKKVAILGIFDIGKTSDYILTPDEKAVYITDVVSPDGVTITPLSNKLDYGQFIAVTGILKHHPGTNGPPMLQGIPEHYFFEGDSVRIKVLYPIRVNERQSSAIKK